MTLIKQGADNSKRTDLKAQNSNYLAYLSGSTDLGRRNIDAINLCIRNGALTQNFEAKYCGFQSKTAYRMVDISHGVIFSWSKFLFCKQTFPKKKVL